MCTLKHVPQVSISKVVPVWTAGRARTKRSSELQAVPRVPQASSQTQELQCVPTVSLANTLGMGIRSVPTVPLDIIKVTLVKLSATLARRANINPFLDRVRVQTVLPAHILGKQLLRLQTHVFSVLPERIHREELGSVWHALRASSQTPELQCVPTVPLANTLEIRLRSAQDVLPVSSRDWQ